MLTYADVCCVQVLAEISCAKIEASAALEKMCILGCGVSTGFGAV
jgi:S-(hydroxymethyl)glutathione dehydrogenase/alcohol dehydrogenase